jgi:hypothetical protein
MPNNRGFCGAKRHKNLQVQQAARVNAISGGNRFSTPEKCIILNQFQNPVSFETASVLNANQLQGVSYEDRQ